MIIVGIGANLDHPDYGTPRRTCGVAMERLETYDLTIRGRSRWYASEPVIRADNPATGKINDNSQPWYINGALNIETTLPARPLLDVLLDVEEVFGRHRSIPDAPRTIDLDILAYNDEQIEEEALIVPHPRLHLRAFALQPIADLNPDWQHPATGCRVADMIRELPADQAIDAIPDANGYLGTEWLAGAPKA